MSTVIDRVRGVAARVAAQYPELSLIVLFGSRARGDAHASSDWDVAYTSERPLDPLALRAAFADELRSDHIDVVSLDRGSALLRYRVARDGTSVFEREPGNFARFWLAAVGFWCDVAPLVRAGHEAILEGIER